MLFLCQKHKRNTTLRRQVRCLSLHSSAALRCSWRLSSSGWDLLQSSIAVAFMLSPHMAYTASTLSSMAAKWSFSEYIISVRKWITGTVQVKALPQIKITTQESHPLCSCSGASGDVGSNSNTLTGKLVIMAQMCRSKQDVQMYLKVQLGMNTVYRSMMHCSSCHAD